MQVHSDSVWSLLPSEDFAHVYSGGRDRCAQGQGGYESVDVPHLDAQCGDRGRAGCREEGRTDGQFEAQPHHSQTALMPHLGLLKIEFVAARAEFYFLLIPFLLPVLTVWQVCVPHQPGQPDRRADARGAAAHLLNGT